MNVLFLTLLNIYNINEYTIYTDLLREFIKHGDSVYIVSPTERKNNEKTYVIKFSSCIILKPRIGNVQKTNLIEKGISTITLERHIKKAIDQYWCNVKFNLILYSTPPITLTNVINYIRRRGGVRTYLLLKDIFPQNSVDLGMMSTIGLRGLLYKYFRSKEKRLYAISDRIGCMSEANLKYVLKHNPEVSPEKVEICPNSIEVIKNITYDDRNSVRAKYDLPLNKKVFVYGGNLGKPQSIPFVIDSISACKEIANAFFFIVGDGTEYIKVSNYIKNEKPGNLKLLKQLPKDEYYNIVRACDVGLIFLDYRFTIPNFPSRLLTYMQAGVPVIAATDSNTDIGKVITNGGFGWSCKSNSVNDFVALIDKICLLEQEYLKHIGNNAIRYLKKHYNVKNTYNTIIKVFSNS
jgi:hypothetical protein